MRLQALRGATTCTEDSKAEIDAKTAHLVKELFARNELTQDDVVSILFTSTPDLTAEFPADRGPHRPRPRPGRAARRPGAGRRPRHAPLHPSARALLHRAATRPSCTTCSSRAPPRCGPTSPGPTPTDGVVAEPKSVALVGTGLIGGSIGLALRRARRDRARLRPRCRTRHRCARRRCGRPARADLAAAVADADLTVVAVPVGHVADVVIEALDAGAGLVTDVGSVKAPVVAAVEAARPDASARYVGGHPMAGSEQEGLAGASADLFVGATWVLTPTGRTDPEVFAELRSWVSSLGAEAIAVAPELHDAHGRGGEPRAAAGGVDAHERGQPGDRRARGAAAARRRRVPRHDPHRVEPSRRSGPTSASPTATPSSARSTPTSTS